MPFTYFTNWVVIFAHFTVQAHMEVVFLPQLCVNKSSFKGRLSRILQKKPKHVQTLDNE